MGRPLFSTVIHARETPAVRVEPEPAQPACERWTYWHPFDPDSEEFFSNAEEERVRSLDGPAEHLDQGRLVIDELSSSSSDSDGTSSGRETPIFVDGDDGLSPRELSPEEGPLVRTSPLHFLLPEDERHTYRANVPARVVQPPPVIGLSSRTATSYVRTPYQGEERSPSRSPSPPSRFSPPVRRGEVATEPFTVPRIVPLATRSAPIAIPARPSTPPNQLAWSYGTPSPAPSVTPRLYTWRGPLPSVASPSSPLTNRTARMSVAHISPSTITVQRVLG